MSTWSRREDDENHGVIHTIKLFIFRIRIFIASFLRGEEGVETPDVTKSLINLDKLKSFEPHTLLTYNPKDTAAPSSEPFMETVRSNLKEGGVECVVRNDSKLFKYPKSFQHDTGTGMVERSEIWKAKMKAMADKMGPPYKTLDF